jgi:hypothetical protein
MSAVLFAFLAVMLVAFAYPPPEILQPSTVGLICGKLVHREYIPEKRDPNVQTVRVKPLRRVLLRLYPSHENEPCCVGITPLAEATTGRNGNFKFKKQPAGAYWLVAQSSGEEFKMLIRYQPAHSADEYCSQLTFSIEDSGRFTVGRTITVE